MKNESPNSLSKVETAKALRLFLYPAIFWAAYGQVAGVLTPIYTGFVLFLGVKESQIGTIVSFAYLGGLAGLIAPSVIRHIRRKQLFIVGIGFAEISLMTILVVAIPIHVAQEARLVVLIALATLGSIMGYLVSPVFSSWLATVIPENIRGRYIGKRLFLFYLSSMVVAYLAGRFLDVVGGYKGFAWLFSFGMLTGIAGYLVLLKVPFPKMEKAPSIGFLKMLSVPFHNKDFTVLLVFYIFWVFGVYIGAPFYNVFMLNRLELSYSTIAILNGISMAFLVIGLHSWGGFIDKYGSKPILQILMVPRVLIPIMWVFNSKENFYLLPVVMALSGLVFSGLTIAINNFLYSVVPKGEEKTAFFASWTATVSLVSFVAPIIGGSLVSYFEPLHFKIFGFSIGNLQLVFMVSAVCLVLPVFLLRFVREEKAVSPGYVLGQLRRGNPFVFAYNFFLFSRAREESKKAQAAHAMGKSKSPMAVDRLAKALDDISPEVRSEAARALGETRQLEAVEALAAKLQDAELDIRFEVTQALGKIRSKKGIESLIKALDDPDTRVRNSAAMALAEIGGEEAKEQLFQKFSAEFDRTTFPTFTEALSRMGDRRIIIPAITRLENYKSSVIRLQILNSICRALGAKNRFYELLSLDEIDQAQQISNMLKKLRKGLFSNYNLRNELKQKILHNLNEVICSFEDERYHDFLNSVWKLAVLIEQKLLIVGNITQDKKSLILNHIQAIKNFLLLKKTEDIKQEGIVFLAVCLKSMVDILRGGKTAKESGPI